MKDIRKMSKYRPEISQQEFEQIERYLLGGMEAAERTAFERRLAEDAVLRDEVNLQNRLMAAVEIGSFKRGEADPGVQEIVAKRRSIPSWLYAAAAVVLAAIGFTGWWLWHDAPMGNENLYTAYFYPDPGLPIAMSSTDRYVFYDGMVSYKEEKYTEAIERWRTLPDDMLATDTLQYYLGMAMLNNGDLDSANVYLQQVSADEQSTFHGKALWYRALIHVKRGEHPQAIRLLETLPSEKRARDLLDKLRQ